MSTTTATAKPQPIAADWRDFYALTKPGVMKLVVFTGLAGMLAASRLPRIAPVSREMILNYVAQHSLGLPKSY